MRAYTSGALFLRSAWHTYSEIDNCSFIEVDRTLLRQAMRAVHLAVVAGEDDNGVLPWPETIQRLEHLIELSIHRRMQLIR